MKRFLIKYLLITLLGYFLNPSLKCTKKLQKFLKLLKRGVNVYSLLQTLFSNPKPPATPYAASHPHAPKSIFPPSLTSPMPFSYPPHVPMKPPPHPLPPYLSPPPSSSCPYASFPHTPCILPPPASTQQPPSP